MFDGLSAQLADLGFTDFDIEVAGQPTDAAPLEGALRLAPDDRGFVLETVDYGTHWPLAYAETEQEAREMVVAYVSRPLPPIVGLPRDEVDRIVGNISHHYFDLRDRAAEAGPRGVVIDLPPLIALDRMGALDGIHLFPIDTPYELRSLPPAVLRPESDVHRFLTQADVRVAATIVPPWFGRPGGGLRFTLQAPGVGIRDLVVSCALQRIHITE